jgi:hypothetical protein
VKLCHLRLRGIWSWVPVCVESQSGLSSFGIESQSGLSPFGVEFLRVWVPVGMSPSGLSQFAVEFIRGWVPPGMSLFGVGSIQGWVHSGLGPLRLGSCGVGSIRWVILGSVILCSVALGSVGESLGVKAPKVVLLTRKVTLAVKIWWYIQRWKVENVACKYVNLSFELSMDRIRAKCLGVLYVLFHLWWCEMLRKVTLYLWRLADTTVRFVTHQKPMRVLLNT